MQRKRYRIEDFLPRTAAPSPSLQPSLAASAGPALPLDRGAAELAAAMEAMEKACAFVLGTAERVEDRARTLADSAASEEARALACEIRDQMARVYEFCNFHDIAGQRIAKVIRLLGGDIDAPASDGASESAPKLVNGPRLDGASGHVTQADVDALFG